MKKEHFVILIDGGIGDHICSTPMIRKYATGINNDKKIIVGCVYSQVLEHLDYIDELYDLRSPHGFFDKRVKTLSSHNKIIRRDIYQYGAHSLYRDKLSNIIGNVYEVGDVDDDLDYVITERENVEANEFIATFDKPVILIHCFGANPATGNGQLTSAKDWFIERWEELIESLRDKYCFVQVGLKNEQQAPGCDCYLLGRLSIRQVIALMNNSYTWIDIDSFMGHAGHAIKKKGIVLLGRSHPEIYAHDNNINIYHKDSCPEFGCGRPQGVFGDSAIYNGVLQLWKCREFKMQCMKAITVKNVNDAIASINS